MVHTEDVRGNDMEDNATRTLIVNWDTLGQALGPDSTDEDEEKFVPLARAYAEKRGWQFETIRDIQKPGFILTVDGEEDDYTAERAFTDILEAM
jgi:hypothetical protein